jgi:hypothetical protein
MRPYFFIEVRVKDCSGNPFLRNEKKIGTKSLVSLLAKTPILFLQILLFVLKQRNKIQGCIKLIRPYFFSEVRVKDCSGNPFLRNEKKIGTKSLVSLLAKTP